MRKASIDRNEPDGVVAEAEEGSGLGNGHVGFGGTVDDAAADAGLVGGRLRFARHAQAHEVCGGTAQGEAAAESLAADRVRQPADDRALDCDPGRSRPPRCGVLVQHGGGEFAQRCDWLARSENIAEKARRRGTREAEHIFKAIEGGGPALPRGFAPENSDWVWSPEMPGG